MSERFGYSLVAFALVGLWLLLLHRRARARGERLPIAWRLKPIHAIQPALQVVILSYLALYWTGLRELAPWLALQVLFGYALDCGFSWSRFGSWRIGAAPLPIVLSTSLFLYYEPRHFWLTYVLHTVSFAGKAWIQRDGRHVFNPSAFGIGVMTLGWLTFSRIPSYRAIDHEFGLAPNIVEVLFLLALVSQWRVPIAWTTLGAYAWFAGPFLIPGNPETPFVFYPATFIAILLLLPDPATSPKDPIGRFLFGVLYAIAFDLIAYEGAIHLGHSASSKILAVLVANLFVRPIDRLVEWVPAWLTRPLDPHFNPEHMLLWALVFGHGWVTSNQKGILLQAQVEDHLYYHNPWVVLEDGRAPCDRNPAYCQVFSFREELAMWRRGRPEAP